MGAGVAYRGREASGVYVQYRTEKNCTPPDRNKLGIVPIQIVGCMRQVQTILVNFHNELLSSEELLEK